MTYLFDGHYKLEENQFEVNRKYLNYKWCKFTFLPRAIKLTKTPDVGNF